MCPVLLYGILGALLTRRPLSAPDADCERNGNFTPVIKVPPISSGLTGHVCERLRSSLERPLFAWQQGIARRVFGYGSFGARLRAHRRNKPAGIGRRRVPRDRPPGCQPFVVTGAVQRRQHQSERMAAIRRYIGASRRPAQRSLGLQPADSPSRLMRPFPPEASAALLPPPLLRLLPGGAIQFPGGSFLPLWSSAFHGALQWGCFNKLTAQLGPVR